MTTPIPPTPLCPCCRLGCDYKGIVAGEHRFKCPVPRCSVESFFPAEAEISPAPDAAETDPANFQTPRSNQP